jgi:osmoprotectant transport system permease protein
MASMQVLNVGQAIPKLALLALAMSLLGIGGGAAIFGLWVATLLPVAVNTYEGLRAVPRQLIEAAEAMGMTPRETLLKVEIPNAMNVIFAGIRTALAINVGTAPLAFLVGGGGLGELIFTGIDLNDFGMMLAGAASTALLAIAVDMGCGLIQTVVVSRGLRLAGR